MEQRMKKLPLPLLFLLTAITLLISSASLPLPAEAYTNYTVGDSLGWYDPTIKPDVNYQKWADGKNFSLGDFLVFNTDTNHSVVRTYNLTTYKLCNYEDSLDSDTTQFSSSDPSNTATHPVTVAVPLIKEGMQYFFSADYDGDQCRSGQQFQINVKHGQGLPKSMSDEQSPAPVSPVSGSDDESAPDTVISSNFNNPHNETESDADDNKGDSSGADPVHLKSWDKILKSSFLFLLGFAFHIVMA